MNGGQGRTDSRSESIEPCMQDPHSDRFVCSLLDPTPFAGNFVTIRTPTRLPDFAIPYLSGTYRLVIGACGPLTHFHHRYTALISTANLSIQFGAKPLFENVSVKFGNGNRYGLIGANGSGKSTLMKILTGELEPTAGNVSTDPKLRIGKLSQDQFAYEEYRVLDAVIMGYEKLWQVMQERNRLYSLPEMSDEDGMHVAELEIEFAEMDGYSAESRAGELLEGIGIPVEQHEGPMSAVAPGWKLRVLLAQALFSDPDILLLDEPTNNLDINAIRWLEEFLETSKSTMVIISHDRHFLNSVCSHMADLDYGKLHVFPGNYDEYMTAATRARERVHADNAKKKVKIAELQTFVSRFSANASKARQATSRARQLEKIELEDIKPSSRVSPFIRFEQEKPLRRYAVEATDISKGFDEGLLFANLDLAIEAGSRIAILGPNGIGKTTLARCLLNELEVNDGNAHRSTTRCVDPPFASRKSAHRTRKIS